MVKQNRSSVIRVIISNYDNKGIKEIKVRYNKQAQLDSFIVDSTVKNGVFQLNSIKEKAKEKYRYSFCIEQNGNEVIVTKKDRYSSVDNKIIRKYKVEFSLSERNKRVVVVNITDMLDISPSKERVVRRATSQTERKLIDIETQENYSKIAKCKIEEVDAVKIYKIKRYLTYRSNMLMFFALINDFICNKFSDRTKKEVYKVKNENLLENLETLINDEISNYNNRIDNIINQKNSELEIILDEKEKKRINGELKRLKDKKIEIDSNTLYEDAQKILKVYSDFRHKLFHYEYKYFENLFENNFDESNELTEQLDLQLFKKINLIRDIRLENKTNYLEDSDTITILGKSCNAKELYKAYNLLCEQKNGFNKFINSFFSNDGVENFEFKEKINKKFEEELLSEKNTTEVEMGRKYKDTLHEAYVLDIHNSKAYKELYNKRKELVASYNATLTGDRNKTYLKECSTSFVNLKRKMEEMTKTNSLLRLKYKLQIAYGFLISEYDGEIKKFKNEFDISKVEMIEKFKVKEDIYLNCTVEDEEIIENILSAKKDTHDISWLEATPENNLFKFYVLTYLLLPIEFKGDFLGFVKKHYYDIKNIDFLDENDNELTPEQLEQMKNDSLFNKIRVFEKNNKKYSLFKNSFLEENEVEKYYKLLNIKADYYNIGDRGLFNKNIILPLYKYYQIVLKLYNDVELNLLMYLAKKNNQEIEKVMENTKYDGKYNFQTLLNRVNEIKSTESAGLRNSIAHLSYNKFLEKVLEIDIEKGSYSVNDPIKELIDNFVNTDYTDYKVIDFDFVNDYYMKKEQFIFGQLKQSTKELTTTNEEKKEKENRELLKKYGVNKENLNSIYKLSQNIRELVESELFLFDKKLRKKIKLEGKKFDGKLIDDFKSEKDQEKLKKLLLKDSSDILGIYKKEVVREIKKVIVEKLKYREEKVLKVKKYDQTTKESKVESYRITRIGAKDEFKVEKNKVVKVKDGYKIETLKRMNKKEIDLRQHYCFNLEYIYKS